MKIATITRTKTTAAIAITLLLVSAFLLLLNVPVQAQEYTNMQEGGSIPLPAGVTPDETYETIAHMNFRPNPIGVNQPLLVNIWMQPPVHISHYQTGYTVTLTKPDGTEVLLAQWIPIAGTQQPGLNIQSTMLEHGKYSLTSQVAISQQETTLRFEFQGSIR
jgi:hypothetical protein